MLNYLFSKIIFYIWKELMQYSLRDVPEAEMGGQGLTRLVLPRGQGPSQVEGRKETAVTGVQPLPPRSPHPVLGRNRTQKTGGESGWVHLESAGSELKPPPLGVGGAPTWEESVWDSGATWTSGWGLQAERGWRLPGKFGRCIPGSDPGMRGPVRQPLPSDGHCVWPLCERV